MRSVEEEVLAANAAFYAAFARGDLPAMDAVWARRAPVACVHPGWEALVGRDRVMASWRRILQGGAPPLVCAETIVHLLGESAYVTCIERVPGGALIATNVFVREGRDFKLVHHHAGPGPREPPERQQGPLN